MTSNKPVVAGKKPVSQKPKPSSAMPDFFRNKLQLPDDIAAELKARSLEGRWISYTKFVNEGNSHERGWSIYKAAKRPEAADAFQLGASPDGIIRRGDSVLAVRPIEQCDKHRAWLRDRANRQNSSFKRAAAEELRQMARDAHADVSVHEGDYEDN